MQIENGDDRKRSEVIKVEKRNGMEVKS